MTLWRGRTFIQFKPLFMLSALRKGSQKAIGPRSTEGLSPENKLRPCLSPASERRDQQDLQRRSSKKLDCTQTFTKRRSEFTFYQRLSASNHRKWSEIPFPSRSPRSQLLQLKKEKLEYIPGEHEYGLFPAPIHVGEFKSDVFKVS